MDQPEQPGNPENVASGGQSRPVTGAEMMNRFVQEHQHQPGFKNQLIGFLSTLVREQDSMIVQNRNSCKFLSSELRVAYHGIVQSNRIHLRDEYHIQRLQAEIEFLQREMERKWSTIISQKDRFLFLLENGLPRNMTNEVRQLRLDQFYLQDNEIEKNGREDLEQFIALRLQILAKERHLNIQIEESRPIPLVTGNNKSPDASTADATNAPPRTTVNGPSEEVPAVEPEEKTAATIVNIEEDEAGEIVTNTPLRDPFNSTPVDRSIPRPAKDSRNTTPRTVSTQANGSSVGENRIKSSKKVDASPTPDGRAESKDFVIYSADATAPVLPVTTAQSNETPSPGHAGIEDKENHPESSTPPRSPSVIRHRELPGSSFADGTFQESVGPRQPLGVLYSKEVSEDEGDAEMGDGGQGDTDEDGSVATDAAVIHDAEESGTGRTIGTPESPVKREAEHTTQTAYTGRPGLTTARSDATNKMHSGVKRKRGGDGEEDETRDTKHTCR